MSGTLIAILFQQVNSYFGILGGTAGVMMAGGIPAICYFKMIGVDSKHEKCIIFFMGAVSVIGMAGAIMSLADPQ